MNGLSTIVTYAATIALVETAIVLAALPFTISKASNLPGDLPELRSIGQARPGRRRPQGAGQPANSD